MTGFVKKTQKYYILTIREGYQALLAVFSLTDKGYSLKLEIYKLLFQCLLFLAFYHRQKQRNK